MRDDEIKPGYLGAMLDSERRLVLVPLDPDRPWAAFRRMRSWMKRRTLAPRSSVDMFTSPPDLESAEVISLQTRRRAGDG